MQNRNLFSERALATISSPEQLDQHIKIIKPTNWIVLFGVLALLVAAVYWCFFGNIADGQRAQGIIFPQGGVAPVSAGTSGTVTDVLVSEGDYVYAGQTILSIYDKAGIDAILALKELGENADKQVLEYESTAIVKSEVNGIIQSVVSRNEVVAKGQRVAAVINEDRFTNSKELIVYVPLATAQKFKVGMEAQVSPTYAPRETYGYMRGYITDVGIIPVTAEKIAKTLGDVEFAGNFLSGGNSIEMRIALSVDAESSNSFLWSNPKGETISVDTNTLCDVLIVFENKRPIDLLFR